MFLRKKTLLAALQPLHERLDRLEAGQTAPAGGAQALEKFAVSAVESTANNLRAMGDFMGSIAEIGASRAASMMGRRRAAKAVRAKNGRYLPKDAKPACRLCANPSVTNPSLAEIRAHETHESGAAPQITYEDQGDRVVAHVPEGLIDRTAEGHEQIECPDCGNNHAPKVIH